jgi:GTP-binding protein
MSSQTYSADEIEESRRLFAGECEFVIGAMSIDDIPPINELPEVAFIGISNVGKSTLVNSLTGRKTLARTSSNPGRTQQVNFFKLREAMYLVDLPGYGFARASKKEIARWNLLIKDYLQGRPNLKRVFLLLDVRRGLKQSDHDMMRFLDECAVNYQIVFTKLDKIPKVEADKTVEECRLQMASHPAAHPEFFLTSSVEGLNISELRAEITRFV